jgi:adenosylmethionine-8-amino-7-oxononanoate aminotransferase
MCLAKGLTGGSLPLAVTLCRPEIFEAHRSADRAKTFFHSSSYTANPIACAAAVANLAIWETEPVGDRIAQLSALQGEGLERLARLPGLSGARQLGTITAIDLTVSDAGYLATVGLRLGGALIERGVLIRPLGNTIYVMPPYCLTSDDVQFIYAAIGDAIVSFA